MRIYSNPFEAVREVERDLFEMGIDVQVQTMQDKVVADNPDYLTKEVRGYGFKINGYAWKLLDEISVVQYLWKAQADQKDVTDYIDAEFRDRIAGAPMNPGNSCQYRNRLWNEFIHEGLFSYTYSERMTPQLYQILNELRERPATRQAIVNIHSNIAPSRDVQAAPGNRGRGAVHFVGEGADLHNMGGVARIPCSMYYQLMIRENAVDLIYTMRSCDFLTHFVVDLMLALRLQNWFAQQTNRAVGAFTYFTGSLHAYHKDMAARGIF